MRVGSHNVGRHVSQRAELPRSAFVVECVRLVRAELRRGRNAVTLADAHPDIDAYSYSHTYSNANANANTGTDTYADTGADGDTDTYADTDAGADSHSVSETAWALPLGGSFRDEFPRPCKG